MGSLHKTFWGLLLMAALATACGQPTGRHAFRMVTPGSCDTLTAFTFEAQLEETTALYHCELCVLMKPIEAEILPLAIEFLPPTGEGFEETFEVPLERYRKARRTIRPMEFGTAWKDMQVRPEEAGIWKIRFRITDPAAARALMGFGFYYDQQ